MSVTGTFLVRSGILNSVHTFASDPSRGLFILSFLIIDGFFLQYLFFLNLHQMKIKNTQFFQKKLL